MGIKPIWLFIPLLVSSFIVCSCTDRVVLPKPAEFQVNKIEISPSEVGPLQTITITVEIGNTGGVVDNYTAILSIDGKESDNKTVTIKPSENKTVAFSVTELNIGLHEVEIGSAKSSFNTIEARDKNTEVSNKGIPPAGRSRGPDEYIDWEISTYGTYGENENCLLICTITNKHDKWIMEDVSVRGVLLAHYIPSNDSITITKSIPCGTLYDNSLTWQWQLHDK